MERLTEWIDQTAEACCESCLDNTQNCDCEDCLREVTNRLAAIEDILGDEYDLDRLAAIMNQRMSMREDVAERWKLTSDIPIDRLAEIVRAEILRLGMTARRRERRTHEQRIPMYLF